MLKSKTVFVVGAGASCELGLPSGHDLKAIIASLLAIKFPDGFRQQGGDPLIYQAMKDAVRRPDRREGDPNSLLAKAWQIGAVIPSAALSIDNYLDAHSGDTELELVGKLGIAKAILDAEKRSKLANPANERNGLAEFPMASAQGTWLMGLLTLLTEGVHRDGAADILENASFVIFNYDRCVEHFLARGLAEYYNIAVGDARRIVERCTMHHPYGQVGRLPWQQGETRVAYGQNGQVALLPLAQQLRTFTEKIEDAAELAAIKTTVSEAETVVFLGFAFHEQNMSLIAPDGVCQARRVFGTCMGISGSDLTQVITDINTLFANSTHITQAGNFPLHLAPLACAGLFNEFGRLMRAAA